MPALRVAQSRTSAGTDGSNASACTVTEQIQRSAMRDVTPRCVARRCSACVAAAGSRASPLRLRRRRLRPVAALSAGRRPAQPALSTRGIDAARRRRATPPTLRAAASELQRGLRGLAGQQRRSSRRGDARRRARLSARRAPRRRSRRCELRSRRGLGREGYLIRSCRDRRAARPPSSPPTTTSACCTARSISCACCRRGSRSTTLDMPRAPRIAAARAQSLGQSRSARRARLRRRIDLGLAQAAGLSRSALHRLRARQRVARHQRHGAQQRQRQCDEPDARCTSRRRRRWPTCSGPTASACILTARFSAPIEIGGLKTADPLDPAVQRVVAGEGRRDLPRDSRLRRLPGQGQLRRPARAAGLRPHPRRRRQHARRRAGAARRHRDVARVRLLATSSPTTAPSRRTTSSCRSTASSATTCWCR